ncbi:universal stress protein [Paramagnetospirillum magneticum]|uniref:Universal stress protein UspA and related nucleotide-binding protein n=1 Tax=Paramagnetospirillum magneticum (strain ATCC 700264 / AMB-1) TaxID=342108 RepID=Q2W427_PARM1|nr:universal stress protein [Paramagnetospirillum magneticum]BAE51398.1 Universal stress protein UspA and related nucleotide-binding protein [Paramagnetospirillum magneticum AMB-1]
MAIKEILVHVEPDAAGAGRLDLARMLAAEHGARLVGVGEGDLAPEGVDEWRPISGVKQLALHARYADLTIVGQAASGSSDHVTETVMSVGRPLLAVPRHGRFPSVGRRVLVAWNQSREATRAVFDALPLLAGASSVTVMTMDAEDGDGRVAGADIGLTLARHGIKVDILRSTSGDIDAGNALLSRAAEQGADLLIMGAFGHSPLREKVLGGATRHILDHMTVPVLLSH